MEAVLRKPPPDWDQRAVAAPYLSALRQRFDQNAIEPSWLDGLFCSLSQELRAVYREQDVDRALEGLDRLLAKYDSAEQHMRAQNPSRASARILECWNRISRRSTPPPPPQQSYNNQAAVPPVETPPTRSKSPPTRLRLNGRAMHKSAFPTWIFLVAMSWVALVWGAIISLPFGVGLAVFASMIVGFITVPAWATLWSWLGMAAARDSTLRSMNFKEVPPDHPLAVISGAFARDLDLPPPRIGTMDVANAFAMGTRRTDAAISFGMPLLEIMSPDEVAAIIGHELGHVVSGDMRRMMLMRTFQNATVFYMLTQRGKQFTRWVICWAAELMILGSSRRREFYADAVGAALAGKEAMISALRKLESAPPLTSAERTHARFMARGIKSALGNLFSTHPTFESRVRALAEERYIRRLPRR
ncbi:M48 family metalloprotease [Hyphomicrobium sp. B1]|uniref:M48 family metalloprotease n=1 Tax=Hyphomicrobium sp. B1 TaxID=3075651 RepID=UPI003C2E06FE